MKLWQSKNGLDKDVEEYTVGNGYLFDQRLVEYDCIASIAHAKLLLKMKIINSKEHQQLVTELRKIIRLNAAGKFKIIPADEDVHTKIENYLTKKLGTAGKKIHTLRSRNDQVLVALRLYSKSELAKVTGQAKNLIQALRKFATKTKGTAMPGYTHMQRAMPSSVGLWAGAFQESLKADLKTLELALWANDENPLGSAAGYGLPVKIDKNLTTKSLGFSRHFENPLYVQNTRQKTELTTVFALLQAMLTLNKLASDLMLFTTKEFGFFSLPKSMCTGSSIMPQKRNYDALEIMRANFGAVSGNFYAMLACCANLPSGYNRDAQLGKGRLMDSFDVTLKALKIARKIIMNLEVDKIALKAADSEELYAAQRAIKMSLEGVPFRESYKKVSKGYE